MLKAVSTSGSGGGGGTVVAANPVSFYFQPGGIATGNVYNSWPALYTDLNKASGVRIVTVDNSLATATIPAGTYNLADVILIGHIYPADSALIPTLNLADQCFFTEMPYLEFITLNSLSSSPIITYTNGKNIIDTLDNLSSLQCSGTAEFIRFDNASGLAITFAVIIKSISTLSGSTGKEVVNAVNSAQVFLYLEENVTITASALKGDNTSEYIGLVSCGSAVYSSNQPNMLGAVIYVLSDLAANHQYTDTYAINAGNVQTAIDTLINAYGVPVTGSGTSTSATPIVLCAPNPALAANSAFALSASVTVRDQSNTDGAYYEVVGYFRRAGAGITQQGTTQALVTIPSTAGYGGVNLVIFGGNVQLQFAGVSGHTLNVIGEINVRRIT